MSTEILNRASRVSSLVDNDTGTLIKTLERNERLFERPRRTKEESTPPTPSVNESRSDPFVKPPYRNLQILNEHTTPSTRISDHYEVAPINEVATPFLDTPPESHDQPPAIPPKAQPPPIPPKSVHRDSQIRYSIH